MGWQCTTLSVLREGPLPSGLMSGEQLLLPPPSPLFHPLAMSIWYNRPLGDMNHVTPDGHLVGISPSLPLIRSTSPASVYHSRPWTPPLSPTTSLPSAAPAASSKLTTSSLSPRNYHHHHHHQSPHNPLPAHTAKPTSTSPRPYAPGESAFLANLASLQEEAGVESQRYSYSPRHQPNDETFEERRERASTVIPCAPQPHSPPRHPPLPPDAHFTSLPHTLPSPPMVLTSYDPFTIPPLPPSAACMALRLHLCPAPVLLRALAIAAQHTSGFLTCDAFVHAVQHWSPRVDTGRAPVFTPFLQSLYDYVLREAPRTSRNWHMGKSQVDFRLPGAALLPYLPITPPRERLGLVWGMWGGRVKVKEAVAALASICVGRVVGAMGARAEVGETCPWRVSGGIERYARALVQAFCEDTKSGGGDVPLEGLLRWLHLRQVLVF